MATDGQSQLLVTGCWLRAAGYGLLVTGSFGADTLTLAPGHTLYKPQTAPDASMFVARYDAVGAVRWCRGYEGTEWLLGEAVGVDGAGNAYVTGYLYNFNTDKPDNFAHLIVAQYDPMGKAMGMLKTAGHNHEEEPHAIAVDRQGNAAVVGKYHGTPAFGATTLPAYPPAGNDETALFVTKLGTRLLSPVRRAH